MAQDGPWSRAARVDPFATGPVRYALDVPAIDMDTYAEMQELLLRPAGPRPRWRRWLTWLAFALAGALVGLLLSYAQVRASLSLGVEGGAASILGGRAILFGALGLVVLTAIVCLVATAMRYGAVLARLHSAASAVVGPQHLSFGDDALLARNDRRAVWLSWSTLTDVRQGKTCLFLIFNGMEAVWLPHDLLASHPGLEAFASERRPA